MEHALFATAFILQFVGHRIGDYLFQTDYQAQNKAKNAVARARHCIVYAATIGVLMLVSFDVKLALIVTAITFVEHMIIDSRKPVVGWKKLLERVVGNKGFDIDKMPFFVLIEIDQTIHMMRILGISLLIAYGLM
jgi:hypothetical protein